jgi:hypothetical protein
MIERSDMKTAINRQVLFVAVFARCGELTASKQAEKELSVEAL